MDVIASTLKLKESVNVGKVYQLLTEIGLRDGLVCAAAFLLTKLVISARSRAAAAANDLHEEPRPLPPSPPGLPLLGNALMMREDMREVIRRLSEEYGGLFSLRVGPKLMVFPTDMDAIKEAFLNQGDAFSDRSMPPILRYAVGYEGSFIFSNGRVWRARRRFGLKAMRSFGVGKTSMEHRIQEEARILIESFENNQEVDFAPDRLVTNAVANVICSISFGFRYDYSDPVFEKVIIRMHDAISTITFFSPGQIFPALLHTPLYRDLRTVLFAIKSLVQGVVSEHRESLDDHHIRDIIDLYIMEIRRQKKDGEDIVFSDDRVWRSILDLFIAGTGTTSGTLLWAIFLMAKFPEAMRRVQEEIDRVVGDHRLPSMADQEAMPLTMATIMEIQRFRPVVPMGVPRLTSRDVDVLGYRIPKGTTTFMPLWHIMHSPKYWKEPETFNPSRFLSDDGQTVLRPEAFIPFGIGHRVCMGELLAKMELFIFFSSLMQRFTFQLSDDSRDCGMDGRPGIALVHPAYKVRVRTR